MQKKVEQTTADEKKAKKHKKKMVSGALEDRNIEAGSA